MGTLAFPYVSFYGCMEFHYFGCSYYVCFKWLAVVCICRCMECQVSIVPFWAKADVSQFLLFIDRMQHHPYLPQSALALPLLRFLLQAFSSHLGGLFGGDVCCSWSTVFQNNVLWHSVSFDVSNKKTEWRTSKLFFQCFFSISRLKALGITKISNFFQGN